MSRELLSRWLKVPADPWPPDAHTLLGIGDDAIDDLETRVLERMEILRPFQLKHPEAVTEGMNLLAAALNELTESLSESPPNETLDDEPVYPLEEPLPLPAVERPSPRRVSKRRALYAEIGRLSRTRDVWEKLQNLFDEGDRTFARRTRMNMLIDALNELRLLLDKGPTVNKPGHLVAALARQPIDVDTLRALLPDQRDALAQDCRAAQYALHEAIRDRRDEVRTRKGWARRYWHPFLRELAKRPEWICLAGGIVALSIALARS